MYIYALISSSTGIVESFMTTSYLMDEEEATESGAVLVDAIDETWIQRKKWNAEEQVWEDVLPTESNTRNSLEFTHIDADGTKHWLDDYINDLAEDVANAGGSVETATVSEVETYLGI